MDLIGRPLKLDILVLMSACMACSLNSSIAGGGRGEWGGEGGAGEGDREYGASSSIVGVFDICKTIWNSVLILGCGKLNSELCRVPVKLDPYT